METGRRLPAEGCQQNGNVPKLPFHYRGLMPSAGTESFSTIRKALEVQAVETFFIVVGAIALAGVCIWLFVFEPRRKIYDDV